jgi:hypothetical protein
VKARRASCALALTLASAALAAGCGGGKTSTSAANAGAEAEIEQNWVTFFDGSTPAAKRISLLQGGKAFGPLLKALDGSALASQVRATVEAVRIDGPTRATVTYTVLLAGQPVLRGTQGVAVLVGGVWQVGRVSFCQLLGLEGVVPATCYIAPK